jgi:DNA gyrase/topoisomerase IV subunit A
MLVTSSGIVTRIKAGDISCQGRPATGVRAQNLMENDTVVSVNKIVNTDKDEEELSGSCTLDDMQPTGEQTSLLEE